MGRDRGLRGGQQEGSGARLLGEQQALPFGRTESGDGGVWAGSCPGQGWPEPALGTCFPVRMTSTSETGTSTPCQEYRSTSATTGLASDSSLPKTQCSDSRSNREAPSPSRQPRKCRASQGQTQSPPEATRGQRQRPSKIKAIHSPTQRFRRAKTACGQSRARIRGPGKTKIRVFHDPSGSLNNTKANQGQSWMPNETEAALSPGQGMSSSSSKTDATQGLGQHASKTSAAQGPGRHAARPGAE